jgi:inorganic pyrophosphatase
MAYTTRVVGAPNTTEWSLYFEKNGVPVSPFHDIPLWVNKEQGIVNMVVEIPRGTTAKLEINKAGEFNPIKQDIKDGKLRHVNYRGGYTFNYGALPQTWEDPAVVDNDTNAKGDNDPLDICEIGSSTGVTGHIKQVKILGVWAMIDAGETDWKILSIDVTDPKADRVNSIEDVQREYPGVVEDVFEFLENYKTPAKNQFAFGGKLLDKDKAMSVTEHCNQQWRRLAELPPDDAKPKKISVYNSSLSNMASVPLDQAKQLAKY